MFLNPLQNFFALCVVASVAAAEAFKVKPVKPSEKKKPFKERAVCKGPRVQV